MLRVLFGILVATTFLSAETYHVYYLGGQSNMDGYGKVSELPADLQGVNNAVPIFHGNPKPDGEAGGGMGVWAKVRAGHGAGFSADSTANKYSNRFGIEVTFVRRLNELRPGEKIALIKYSRGGTSIDETAARWFGSWEADFVGGPPQYSGVNQYDNFLATLRNAFAERDIDDDGTNDMLIPAGILWMQGESDAATATVAKRYGRNLKRLMDLGQGPRIIGLRIRKDQNRPPFRDDPQIDIPYLSRLRSNTRRRHRSKPGPAPRRPKGAPDEPLLKKVDRPSAQPARKTYSLRLTV